MKEVNNDEINVVVGGAMEGVFYDIVKLSLVIGAGAGAAFGAVAGYLIGSGFIVGAITGSVAVIIELVLL